MALQLYPLQHSTLAYSRCLHDLRALSRNEILLLPPEWTSVTVLQLQPQAPSNMNWRLRFAEIC